MVKVFKNASFTKRDYNATNLVFAFGENTPQDGNWVEAESDDYYMDEYQNIYFHLSVGHLYTKDGVRYFGYL
jgi:hypothetical protein